MNEAEGFRPATAMPEAIRVMSELLEGFKNAQQEAMAEAYSHESSAKGLRLDAKSLGGRIDNLETALVILKGESQ